MNPFPCASSRVAFVWLAISIGTSTLFAASTGGRPAHLTTDSLVEPLGIDSEKPQLSWQLEDPRPGARQTAYTVQVASKPALLLQDKADLWDSGRVTSDRSVGVAYGGPALEAEKRYYWRVKVWDKDGKPYAPSAPSWWETGLMKAENWQGRWIGYEDQEEQRVRESGAQWITNAGGENYKGNGATRHDFRLSFDLGEAPKRAVLYVAGKDTASAWVNGKKVMDSMPMPPWKHFPWQTYNLREVTGDLHSGPNSLAVEVILYAANPNGMADSTDGSTPMNACLYVENTDGSATVLKSGGDWKASLNSAEGWHAAEFDDSQWAAAIPYVPPSSAMGNAPPGNPWPTGSVKLLRQRFEVESPVASARLYVTALGAYQAQVNGHRVGDQVLAPGWMDFREHVPYQAYDVTAYIKSGANVVGAYLAPGWYTTPLMWFRQSNNYGKTPPALKAQLRIQHVDGSVQWVASDASWKADISPILKAEIYDGETYDARRVQPGWDTASFTPVKEWKPVEVIQPVEPRIVAQYFPPVRVEKTLKPKAITSPAPGVYLYDFGQNFAGVPSLRVHGPAATDVQLRFGEVLNPDGSLYTENLRTAKATDHFILSGKGVETYEPTFTFHGFRYVEISGLPASPGMDAVKAQVLHTDTPFTAQLHTGSPMINQLWENILWGQRSNFVSVPTDCPQRDERLGWTADAQVFWRTASYNMDLTQFSKKFASDVQATQVGTTNYGIFAPGTSLPNPGYGAGWSDAGIIVPWTGWLQSGDTRIIEENWEGMQKYLQTILEANPDHLWKQNSGIPFGDWLSPEGPTVEPLVATAYWAYDVTLMEQMAHALDKTEDEARYRALFLRIKQAFGKAFVREDGLVAGADNGPSPFGQINNPNAKAKGIDTQTGYVLGLQMDLIPASLRKASGEKLVEKIRSNGWKLGTGFLGTPYLLAVLVDTGHSDVAYRLLLNTEYPSWGYLVGHGATTMWERWNGDQMRGDPSMNSYNHYAYGAVADWIYRYAAGIDVRPADAGFHTVYLHPTFDARLGSLDFTYSSLYGPIRSSWSAQGAHTVWKVSIPANATGEWELAPGQAESIQMDGAALEKSSKVRMTHGKGGTNMVSLVAGAYTFTIAKP